MLGRDERVQLAEEVDGLEVLAAAVHVGNPRAGRAGVVEVEHRGHGVDPQAVDVELLQPVQGVGDEEVAHLVAAVVEDERAPVGVLALGAGRRARTAAVPSKRASAHSSLGKCAGTQSAMTPMPRWCRWSTKKRKSSGVPKRDVGA